MTVREIDVSPLLEQKVSEAIAVRQYNLRTEIIFQYWIKRYIVFHQRKHPGELGAPEIKLFLSHLEMVEGISVSTQNVVRAALLFLYREVLQQSLPDLDERR